MLLLISMSLTEIEMSGYLIFEKVDRWAEASVYFWVTSARFPCLSIHCYLSILKYHEKDLFNTVDTQLHNQWPPEE